MAQVNLFYYYVSASLNKVLIDLLIKTPQNGMFEC